MFTLAISPGKGQISKTEDIWTTEIINKYEDSMLKVTKAEKERESRLKKNEQGLRDLWAWSKKKKKKPNIFVMAIPEGKENLVGIKKKSI